MSTTPAATGGRAHPVDRRARSTGTDMGNQTRREFLTRIAGCAVAADLCGRLARAGQDMPELVERPSTGWIKSSEKSIVAHVRSEHVIPNGKVHDLLLADMIEEGLLAITGTDRPRDAWHKLLKKNDVVGIKFNQVGAALLATTQAMARQLVRSLVQTAEIEPGRIMLIEVDTVTRQAVESALSDELGVEVKTRPPVFGFAGPETSFGSGSEQLAALLQDVTALINVPFIKTHNIAGMTGCLKNLSHALVRRPARYHGNQCAPYVGDILALPQIRSRMRLHVANALRIVFDGGPDPARDTVFEHRSLLISTDPVAVDAVGTDLINEHRTSIKRPPIGDALGRIAHLHAAARRGLGTDDQDYIDLKNLKVG